MATKFAPSVGIGVPGGSSGTRRYRFQPWLTLAAPGGTDDIIQPCPSYLDGINETTYHFKVDLTYLSNATLVLESAPSREGTWTTCQAFTGVTSSTIVLSSEGGGLGFSRYIRWRVDGHATNPWEVCFQSLVTSGALGDAVLTPRKA